MNSEIEKSDDSPSFLLWQVLNLWQKNMRQALQAVELTHVQFILLIATDWLNRQCEQGDVTQAQIASYAHVEPMLASQVLRSLEKKGLLTRKEHSTDTRAKSIVLTEEGKQLASQAFLIAQQVDHSFIAKLGQEETDFIRLMKVLGTE
ncbi:MarR family winged helix-turn-helix transcriptional regulator [Paenibacillus hexagrammi]|uniref:MarR family transcriptional regulator n=1 Tax=Paenibacillus hexagrammi TaxID=2908839 RepID=A0ABY3SCI3_9BACL|nr:MarR family transcriptional regulator [Paenibacillus sp. YPD9-1]UJF31713.1 MarR family transcriptional regulator [Paenibacillus sp. YPD9-1]